MHTMVLLLPLWHSLHPAGQEAFLVVLPTTTFNTPLLVLLATHDPDSRSYPLSHYWQLVPVVHLIQLLLQAAH